MKRDRVSVSQAKAHLSELLERAHRKDLVLTITRHGRPVARIVPLGLVAAGAGHLAGARGWLQDDDPFFAALQSRVRSRTRHRPPAAPAPRA